MFLCGHPFHPVELAMAVATMGGLSGFTLWLWCLVTTSCKRLRTGPELCPGGSDINVGGVARCVVCGRTTADCLAGGKP